MTDSLAVVGLGRVGTPLALLAAARGVDVVGLDVDPLRVRMLDEGTDPFGDEEGLGAILHAARSAGRFHATTDPASAIDRARWIVVAVPLWLDPDKEPNFDVLDTAVETIAEHINPGTTVIFETTQPVGTTSTRHARRLSDMTGHKVGEDIFVAFSPERIKVGHVLRDLERYPKIVGGVDDVSTLNAAALYRSFIPDVWTVKNAETAEFIKLAETAYRDVNIALAHELADAADRSGVDFAQVRTAANSQPESDLHTPGIGVGGHCIPVYPYLFMHSTPGLDLVAHGRSINEQRPRHYTDRLVTELGDLEGRELVILGAAYRPDLGLVAHSSVFALVRLLESEGAIVHVLEPHADDELLRDLGLTPGSLNHRYDAAIIHTAHTVFKDAEWHGLAPLLLDGRGLLADTPPPNVRYLAPGFTAG